MSFSDSTYLLQIEPGGFCEFSVQPTNSMHQHPHWEICFVTAGSGEYLENGQTFPLSEGSIFSSPPQVLHEIRSLQTRDLVLFFVSISFKKAQSRVRFGTDLMIDQFLRSRMIVGEASPAIGSMIELYQSGLNSVVEELVIQSFALQAMSDLTAEPHAAEQSGFDTTQVSLIVKRAQGYIRDHVQQIIQVEDVADFVGASSKTLQRHFQAQLGRSVAKEIRSVKYRHCAHQLLMGYSVQQVAETCGILDPSQFSNAFKREIGESPKRFQQKYLQMPR